LATFLSLTCAPSAVRVGLLPARGLHHRAHRPIGAARWGDRGPRGLGLHLGPDLRVSEDIDATHAALAETTKPPWDAVQPGRRITTLWGAKHGISIPVAIMSPHVKHTPS
jgi:hypothetical protein